MSTLPLYEESVKLCDSPVEDKLRVRMVETDHIASAVPLGSDLEVLVLFQGASEDEARTVGVADVVARLDSLSARVNVFVKVQSDSNVSVNVAKTVTV